MGKKKIKGPKKNGRLNSILSTLFSDNMIDQDSPICDYTCICNITKSLLSFSLNSLHKISSCYDIILL